ncbi:MAG: hypothetical protein ACHQFW_01930 [Chitinophagales bacterium]
MANKTDNPINNKKPPFRKLRGYAFDPITSLDLDTADINEIIYKIPWEDNLKPGPEGEYIKVIDRDPMSDAIYKPVDLNDPVLLANDGLSPSETNPQFHQQMTYAVVMTTIKNFEKALGRKVMWSAAEKYKDNTVKYEFVDKLLVYPHGLRDQNAYYSPDRKVLLFGYYNATPANAGVYLPGGIVYSCLSHDILAHETTHALLDGMYSRFMEGTHPDVAAFHEGFADIVALLQHFMYPEIVKNQIRKVRGELDTENLLSKLAVEFGQSTGEYKSLRDAIGETDMRTGKWKKKMANVNDYDTIFECHDRGALLVSAVFDAFIAIYKNRTADLVRIATGGSGIISQGEIHPDLVNRLADEAEKTASHVLNMCIRALDYCPPVDLNFGDYLRALITADTELVANDRHSYRIAFINAFRKRGIFPEGVSNLSVETLCYNDLENDSDKKWFSEESLDFFREFKSKLAYVTDRETIFNLSSSLIRGDENNKGIHSPFLTRARKVEHQAILENLTGLVFSDQYKKLGIKTSRTYKKGPSVEIHSVRLNNRVGPDGNHQNQLIMTLAQKAIVVAKESKQGKLSFHPLKENAKNEESFIFRGGCTLIFDLDSLTLKHSITKPIFNPSHFREKENRTLRLNQQRLEMQYRCYFGDLLDEMSFAPTHLHPVEPFASLHKTKTSIL